MGIIVGFLVGFIGFPLASLLFFYEGSAVNHSD